MYQSVMAKRQGSGSSGTGFGFVLVTIKELLPDKNICIAQDIQTGDQYQVGLNKRGETAWPQLGDTWVLDRSLGHWMLQSKVTDHEAPTFTGNFSTMDADTLQLALLLKGLGLIKDGTTAGAVPTVTGSKAQITPAVQQLISILDARGVLNDLTTAATVAPEVWVTPTLATGWTPYTSAVAPRYKLNYDNTVSIEGRAVAPAGVTSGVTLFTLSNNAYFPPVVKYSTSMVAIGGATGNLAVNPDGTVKLFDFGATTVTMLLFHMRYSRLP